ncbi:MAG: hypothetical protein ACXV79_13545 [Methylobacter sp.]
MIVETVSSPSYHSSTKLAQPNAKNGKRRLHFAAFITKERLNFPAVNHYHVDTITHVIFMTGKLSAQ